MMSALGLFERTRCRDAAEACVVVAHGCGGVVEGRGCGSFERGCPRAALQFVSSGFGLGGAPFPGVAAEVVVAVGAAAGVVGVDCGGVADSVFPDVALRWRGLVTPRVDGAACSSRGFFPLVGGR